MTLAEKQRKKAQEHAENFLENYPAQEVSTAALLKSLNDLGVKWELTLKNQENRIEKAKQDLEEMKAMVKTLSELKDQCESIISNCEALSRLS